MVLGTRIQGEAVERLGKKRVLAPVPYPSNKYKNDNMLDSVVEEIVCPRRLHIKNKRF